MAGSETDAAIDEIAREFALLGDWEERYGHIIDLGKALEPLNEAERCVANKVRGCASQVWLTSHVRDGRLYFRGDSDALIVRGLIALLLRIFSGRTSQDILAADARTAFSRLGLADALTMQRSSGVIAMIERMRHDAAALGAAT